MSPFARLLPVLQLAIGPVILISGVGLLLLSFTNRLGRLIDRVRILVRELRAQPDHPHAAIARTELAMIDARAGILRLAIVLSATTVLLTSILILVLFLAALLRWEAGIVIIVLFCLGQVALIGSLIAFIWEMNLALKATRLEIVHTQAAG